MQFVMNGSLQLRCVQCSWVIGYFSAQYQGPFGQEYRNLLCGKPYATVNLPGVATVVYKVHGTDLR